MDIPENIAFKSLKRNLEVSVDRILSKHEDINDNIELSEDEFNTIVDNISNSKEINMITRKFLEQEEISEDSRQNFIEHLDKPELYDEDKLEILCQQLSQSKSADNKNKALESLMKYPVIDIIDKYKWPKLSKILRDSLCNRSGNLFMSSFKIHVKLSNHPQAIIEATANLLKTLMVLFNSRRIGYNTSSIDLKNPIQGNILKLVNVLLNNFRIIFKNYNTNKERQAEVLIPQLLDLLTIHRNYERTDYIHCFYYVVVVDPKAKWFQQLMHNISTRKVVIQFCYKNNSFLKYVLKEITIYLNDNESTPRKTWDSEISLDIIKFAAFQHYSNIVSILLSYKWGHKLFPVEIKSKETNLQTFIMIIITSIQSLSNYTVHYLKKNIVTEMLKSILINNRHFLFNKDISHALIKQFLLKFQEKPKLIDIAKNNIFVLEIINAICNKQDAFYIIFGFAEASWRNRRKHQYFQHMRSVSLQEPLVTSIFINKYIKQQLCSATQRDNISVGKAIVEFTINVVRYLANSCAKLNSIDNVVYDLLECCCNIYLLHTHALILVNSRKLLQSSLQLYKVMIDHDMVINTMNSLLKLFVITCETRFGTDIFLKDDSESLYILCKHYFFIFDDTLNNKKHYSMYLVNLANTVPGCIAITECKRQVVSPFLNKIWKIDEDEILFLSGSNKLLEDEIFTFFKFIFSLQCSSNCVQSLISYDTDDESTLIDSDEKPTNLKDLIDEAMVTSGTGKLSCILGLQTVRILINNLNILAFLETNVELTNHIRAMQIESTTTNLSDSFIIDECSLLRKNIIDYIDNIGNVKSGNKSRSQHNHLSTTSLTASRYPHEFQKFLNDTRNNLHDQNWLSQARKSFKQTCGIYCKDNNFSDLVQQVRLTVPNNKNHFIWPENDQKLNDLFSEDIIGVQIIVRFGKNNNILQFPTQYEEMLILLLKQVNSFLNINRDSFQGFDWFVGVIFLICSGNIEKIKIILQCMVQLPVGPYMWPALGQQLSQIKKFDYSVHFDHTLNKLIGDLEIFKPALEAADISWNFVVRNWINQCFFNVLPWYELGNFLIISVLFPVEYLLFYIICCAEYLEPKFLAAITNHDINYYLNILQLNGFHISDFLNSMDQLGKQYKNILARY